MTSPKDPVKRRAQWNAWYAKNKAEQRPKIYANRAERDAKIRAWIVEYKESRPCTDCSGLFPAVCMDFDHLRDKTYNVSVMRGDHSWETLMAEIAKCELVCSNCHRVRTRDRLSDGVTGSTQGFDP